MATLTGATYSSRLAPGSAATAMAANDNASAGMGIPQESPVRYRQHGVLRGRLMRAAKYLLPILAIAIAALILVWSQANLPIIRLRIADSEIAPREVDAVSMANPRFAGTDIKNRQYTVTADTATQSPDNDDIIHLQQPKADILMEDGAKVRINADAGIYQRGEKLLDLSGTVQLHEERGYDFRTTQAHVDFDQNLASGEAPVDGTMPQGTLTGEGFRIEENGARLFLLGRSRVVLDSDATKDEEKTVQ
jgi:lipopolysaccharide export system protein LptC